jgi:hypothetical protein
MPTKSRSKKRISLPHIHADVNVNPHPAARGYYYLSFSDAERGQDLTGYDSVEVKGKREALVAAMYYAKDILGDVADEVTVFDDGNEYAYGSIPRGLPLRKSNIFKGGRR